MMRSAEQWALSIYGIGDEIRNHTFYMYGNIISSVDFIRAIQADAIASVSKVVMDDESNKPDMPEHSYARQWAADTLSGKVEGGRFLWGERNLAKCYFNLRSTSAEQIRVLREALEDIWMLCQNYRLSGNEDVKSLIEVVCFKSQEVRAATAPKEEA